MQEEKQREKKSLFFVAGYFLFLTVLYGIKTADIGELILLNQNPFQLISDPAYQFLHGSILPIFLGNLLDITTRTRVEVFYGCIIAITWMALLFWSRKRFQEQWPIFVLFITAWPLYHVSLEWVGKSDTLLLLGYLILFFSAGPYQAIGALVIMLAHKEMGMLIIFFEVAYTLRSNKDIDIKSACPILAGAAVGLMCHWLYLRYGLDQAPRDRMQFLLEALPNHFWPYIAAHWYLFVFFLLGPVCILLSLLRITPDLVSVACIGLSLVLAMVTADTSRAFVMVSIPAIFHLGARAIDDGKLSFDKATVWKLLAAQMLVFEVISPPMKDWGRSFYHFIVNHILE